MADRIAVMKAGRMIQTDTPQQLYNQPKDAFAASFFGEINVFNAVVHNAQVDTPFGPILAKHQVAGELVTIVLRAESIGFAQVGSLGDNYGKVAVVASRLLGRASLVHVAYTDAQGQPHHLHARINGLFLPSPGQELDLRVDKARAMIFRDIRR